MNCEDTHLLQEHDHVGIVGSNPQLHGDLEERPHHGDVRVTGRSQSCSQVLADLTSTLEEDLVELLIGYELGRGVR